MTPETKIKGRVKKRLREIEREEGAYWTAISQRYHSGLPDFLLIRGGHPIFIETKKPGETLRPLQDYVRKQIIKSGATYWVVTERDKKLVILQNGEDDATEVPLE